MDKIQQLAIGSVVNFKLTLCPNIDAPIIQGILKKCCRVPGWQSVLVRGQRVTTKHYPVKLVEVELLTTGCMVRVDAKGIIGISTNNMEVC